jgi:hypothetical protein
LFRSTARAQVGVVGRGGKARRWGGYSFLHVFPEAGLVVFHGQQVVGAVLHDQFTGGLALGMEGVERDGAPGQVEVAEEFARHGDFVGLGVHQRAAQVVLAGHGDGGEDRVAGPVPGFFAVQDDEFVGRGARRALGFECPEVPG